MTSCVTCTVQLSYLSMGRDGFWCGWRGCVDAHTPSMFLIGSLPFAALPILFWSSQLRFYSWTCLIFHQPPPLPLSKKSSCSSFSSAFIPAAPECIHPLWFPHDAPLISASVVHGKCLFCAKLILYMDGSEPFFLASKTQFYIKKLMQSFQMYCFLVSSFPF